jgi:hypothetical protein
MAWILFSASTFESAMIYLRALFMNGSSQNLLLAPPVLLGFGAFIVDHLYGWAVVSWARIEKRYIYIRAAAYAGMIVLIFHFVPEKPSPFIYFQF